MKRGPLRRWIIGAGMVLALALVAVIAAAGWLLLGSLPKTTGTLALESPGLSASATIGRDAAGIVTITAANEPDGYFALGFAHAQDRLFQMEMMRRMASGRLAEIVGAVGLKSDKLMRTLGLKRQAEAQYAAASPGMLIALEAYAAGVNAYLDGRGGPLPPEFLLLRFDPERWHPVDSLLWGRLMAWQLSGNAGQEIVNESLRGKLDPDLLQTLMRTEGSLAGLTGPGFSSMSATRSASNNWVIAGRLSASGAPLLANDPHLGFNVPVIWYMARIVTPDSVRVGATAPGLPLLVIGSNGHVAWGFTTTHSDTQDLFEERLAPDAPARYETPAGWQPVEIRREIVKVKDGAEVAFDVRATRHGPIISDLDPERYLNRVFALSWPGFAADDRTPEAFLAMNRAGDAAAFRAALRDFHTPQQNVVYADASGQIGFAAAGRVPIRRNIANQSLLPAPGWRADYDWLGHLDFSVLPQLENPPSGRIVTANNDIRPQDYHRFLGQSFERSYRRDRIEQLLAPLSQATTEDMQTIQLDDYSIPLHRFVKSFLPEIAASIPLELSAALSGWDGHMQVGRPEPLIATAWLYATARRVLGDELGVEGFEQWWFWQVDSLEQLLTQDRWCDDPATTQAENCRDAIRMALPDALDALRGSFGADWRSWTWGASHSLSFSHPVFGRIPTIGDWLGTTIAAPGDQFTVNRGGSFARDGGVRFADIHGPGLRMVVDMAQPDRLLFNLAGGQSGHPLSSHYRDLLLDWASGTYRSFEQPARDTLTLRPAAGKAQP
jgi:penicillin amidase